MILLLVVIVVESGICLSVCLPVCLSVFLPACLPACLPTYLSVCLSIYLCSGTQRPDANHIPGNTDSRNEKNLASRTSKTPLEPSIC